MTPAERSLNCSVNEKPSIRRSNGPLTITPAWSMKTGTAQNTEPRMKATVRFSVSSEAIIPSASNAAPISQ